MSATPSLLPPRTRAKIWRLLGVYQKVYVQELIGIYGTKANSYRRMATQVDVPYVLAQAEHFESVLLELYRIMDSLE